MNLILAVDIGTTSIGAVALELDSDEIVCRHSAGNTSSVTAVPANLHEQDPREILEIAKALVSRSAASVMERYSSNRCIRGIVVTGQMHGIVLVDTRHRPASGFITWRDQRAAQSTKVKDLAADAATAQRCGCRLQSGYGLATLHQLVADDAQLLSALSRGDIRVCGITDFVAAHLCDRLVTDPSMAASWGGLDIRSRDWDRQILNALQIPERALPPLRTSADPIGQISRMQAEELGLDPSTIVCAGIGDHQSQHPGLPSDRSGFLPPQCRYGRPSIGRDGLPRQFS